MHKENKPYQWPKKIPPLTEEQEKARERWMSYWLETVSSKYEIFERFNHGYPANLPVKKGSKTLEIGAGVGEQLKWENLSHQDYYCLEYREAFCEVLKKKLMPSHVIQGDIQINLDNLSFDRIIAIHILEHLPNLPAALEEIKRLLKEGGAFDVVLPCEGGVAHSVARQISTARMFKKKFGMDYRLIIQSEHVNTLPEIIWLLRGQGWIIQTKRFFPFVIGPWWANLCVGMRLSHKKTR